MSDVPAARVSESGRALALARLQTRAAARAATIVLLLLPAAVLYVLLVLLPVAQSA